MIALRDKFAVQGSTTVDNAGHASRVIDRQQPGWCVATGMMGLRFVSPVDVVGNGVLFGMCQGRY